MNPMRLFVVATLCWLTVATIPRGALLAQDGVLPLPREDQQEIAARLGPGVVGQALPSNPVADPSIYFPLQDRVLTYQVTTGRNTGSIQTLKVTKRNRPDGTPAWRFGISPTLAGFIRKNLEGDLMMPAVADSDEGVVVVTTPANPFVMNGIRPGETRTFSQAVSVNYLDDPTRQDYSGTLNAAYTYVGTYQVTVPAGTYQAILMRLKYEGKVGPAHTQDTAYYFFAPQVGVVAMISQEDVEAFWIIHIDTRMGKVLVASN
jgi:hypothetical protein